jgi:hypothetical protein
MTTPYHLEPGASQNNSFTAHLRNPAVAIKSKKDHGAAVSDAITRKRIAGARVPETPMLRTAENESHGGVYSRAGQ